MGVLRSFGQYAMTRILWIALTRWLPMAILLLLGLPLLLPDLGPWLNRVARLERLRAFTARRESAQDPARGTASSTAHAAAEEVCFGPEGDCGALVASEIGRARHTVRLQAFTFTSKRVAQAMSEAQHRGIDVGAILDAKEARQTAAIAGALLDAGVRIRLDGAHSLAHNKVVIIDDDEVLTGSLNFSISAEHYNAENLLVLRGDRRLAEAYLKNWSAHWEHSLPAAGALLGK